MIDLTVKSELEKLVSDILSKKEDSDKRELLVKTLKDAKAELDKACATLTEKDSEIEDLTSKLDESVTSFDNLTVSSKETEEILKNKEAELATVSEELEAEKAKVTEHEDKIEKKDIEISSVKEKFEEVSSELEKIKKSAVVEERMSDLEKAGLLRSDEEGVATQREKVANFSDEEYETYKKELEGIKASIVESLKGAGSVSGSAGSPGINLEGDDEPTVKDIGEALRDLFYGEKDKDAK